MKCHVKTALWCDCETDEERAAFFRSGRAYGTGVIAEDLAEPCAQAFEDAAKWRKLVGVSRARRVPPPWGPDAVPLMVCEDAEEFSDCKRCFRSTPLVCDYFCKLGSCLACGVNDDACVQVGWRERSKP
jgi:hypothetical protein